MRHRARIHGHCRVARSPSTKTFVPLLALSICQPFLYRTAALLPVPTKDVLVPGWERSQRLGYVHRGGGGVGISQVSSIAQIAPSLAYTWYTKISFKHVWLSSARNLYPPRCILQVGGFNLLRSYIRGVAFYKSALKQV